jgi:hypothetical protein
MHSRLLRPRVRGHALFRRVGDARDLGSDGAGAASALQACAPGRVEVEQLHAQRDDGDGSGGEDSAGFLRESCALNVAIVTHDGVMRTPPFKGILAGTTLRRAMELSPPLLSEGILSAIKQEEVSLADALAAAEMILFAGDTHIFPVTKLDDKAIGDGMIGPVARAFEQRIQEDAADGKDCHHVVPGL